jgi:hypothetical protein
MPKKKESKLSPQEQELLKEARSIVDLIKMPGWQYLCMYIQGSVTFPDPKDYHSREEIVIPYSEAYGAADLAKKIGNFVNSQESVIKTLSEKVDSENDAPNYAIGS